VIAVHQFLAIKALLEQGVPKKEIARRVGVDPRTVRKWARRVAAEGGPQPLRAVVPLALDPFREQIAERVGRGWTAVQIHRELLGRKDFTASYATVRRLAKALRVEAPDVYCRMRFAPGEEAQVDFAHVGRMDAGEGRLVAVHLLVVTLCFSRLLYAELLLDQTVPSFLGGLRRAFEFFGGAPARVKPDNLRSAVLVDQLGQRHYQEDFFRFCRHYGTVPDAARPYTPTDKGRVERSISYARQSLLRGRAPTPLATARGDLAAWRDGVANVRLHGTTQRRPVDLFEEERTALRPLPAEPYEVAVFGLHRVRKDCHVHVRGNFYSVPWRLVGDEVLVRLTETHVSVLAGEERVAHHARAAGRGQDVTDRSHYPPFQREATQEVHRRRTEEIRSAGPSAADYLGRLVQGRRVRADDVLALTRLLGTHGAAAFDAACRRAVHFDAIDGAATLERILERGLQDQPLPTEPAASAEPGAEGYGRPLREYGALMEEVA
jgi:transposase